MDDPSGHLGIEFACRAQLFGQRVVVLVELADPVLQLLLVVSQARDQRVRQQPRSQHHSHRQRKEDGGQGNRVLTKRNHERVS